MVLVVEEVVEFQDVRVIQEHLELDLEAQLCLHLVLDDYLFGDLLDGKKRPVGLEPCHVDITEHALAF